MKHISLLPACLLFFIHAFAQLSGTVRDSVTKEAVPAAIVSVENSFLVTTTGREGKFSFTGLKEKSVRIKISHIGFETRIIEAMLPGDKLEIFLSPRTYLSDEVIVTATRAADKSPTAFTTVDKAALEKNNLGQDLPFLLNTTPSVVVTSDAGAGVGYTGIRIRGSDAARVNVTINGVPVNDAEENGVYWVDLPDFASSIDNIQIQRGIGTSTNGAGAFGASINILSAALSPQPFATVSESYGSFETWKHTLSFGTGLLKNRIAFEGRLSKINSDGFVDRAASDLKSFYLSGGYYGSKSTLRAIVFSGKEKTYQSWNGVPEAKLLNDYDGLVTHYYNNLGYLYNSQEDSVNLFSSNTRTYNIFNYKNQTDNYQQDYYQLHYSFAATTLIMLNAALHYTKGRGYYEEYKYNQLFSDYRLANVVLGDTILTSTNLIRQKWLDNDFYGFTLSSNYESEKFLLTIGAAGNQYGGRHFDQVVWAQYPSNGTNEHVYNDNDATKNDFNVFMKSIFTVYPRVHVFGDVQYRLVDYTFLGFDEKVQSAKQTVHHSFVNPKTGVTYDISKKNKVYASIAIGHKEPIRKDYIESSSKSRPRAEEMRDVEAGYKFTGNRLRAGINFYLMDYTDQLILTGKINDVGEYARVNVPESWRKGVELEAAWKILKTLSLSGNLTLSQNRIRKFVEYVDDYDTGEQQLIEHSNTDIALSPSIISSAIISWMPVKNFSVDFISKYVGDQFLDNTSNETRMLESYLLNDVLLQYRFSLPFIKEVALKFAVYNILDQEYESNGYTYGYIYGGARTQENFYYPQAGMNWLGGVTLKF